MTIVVTGSSGGLGSAIVSALIDGGYSVLGLDRAEPVQVHSGLTHVSMDLSKPEEISESLKRAGSPVGGIIHCAAEQPLVRAGHGGQRADWEKAFAVNVLSLDQIVSETRLDLKVTAPHRVISISSVHDKTTSRAIAPYSVTKAALSAWTRAASLDLSEDGIVTIGVSPGAIDGPKLAEGLLRFENPTQARQNLISRLPSGRLVRPVDIAKLCLFLLNEESAHFTGSNLAFDGGVSAVLASE